MRIPGNFTTASLDFLGQLPRHAAEPHVAYAPPSSPLVVSGFLSALRGGSPAAEKNPLENIFPNGNVPLSAASLVDFAKNPQVRENLKMGQIYCWIPEVGTALPQFNTVALIPAHVKTVYECAKNVGEWADWMPRFKDSKGIPISGSEDVFHEVLMNADMYNFHYQARMTFEEIPGGFQIRWQIPKDHPFEPAQGKGLRINDGSWTFTADPQDPLKTIMAYQIHTDPDLNGMLLKVAAPFITRLTKGEFHTIIQAFANRSTDHTWMTGRQDHPCGVLYKKTMLGS